MSRKTGVYLVEKRVEPKRDESLEVRVKILKPKNRENRTYSTFYDALGNPIIKLYYGDKRYSRRNDDGRAKGIARYGIIKKASLSFNEFRGYVIKSHFLLTDDGYNITRQFLLDSYNPGSIRVDDKSSNIIITEPYYIHLWHRRKILRVETRLDLSAYPEIEMVEQKIEGQGINKGTLRPRFTTPTFNEYVFDILKQTYSQFSPVFLKFFQQPF